jgi:hypothetical protein
MNEILNKFIENPHDGEHAFKLAEYYYEQNQTAAALGFYLRVTECSNDLNLIYESLIKSGMCLEKQGDRNTAVKGLYLNAISYLPKRPEAYFLLSRLHEKKSEYLECCTLSNTALSNCDFNSTPLRTETDYPGKYGFEFEKAVSLWWLGKEEESINLFLDLHDGKFGELDKTHKDSVLYNIRNLWGNENGEWVRPIFYDKNKKLRFPFKGYEKIDRNYSQAFQDIFVISILNGKTDGKYLEIGANEPIKTSNTYILENKFNWGGISLEIIPSLIPFFNGVRKNTCYCLDATKVDYNQLLDSQNWGYEWDYLQLDCEPPKTTFETLLAIPFDRYKFAVITYEHDYYVDDTKSYREKSRRYLHSLGYKLLVNDVSIDDKSSFEDWWVHPDLIDKNTINKFQHITNNINKIADYILSE